MKLYQLIDRLETLAKLGHSEADVRIIADGDCPTCGEGEAIRGAYVIDNYPDKNIDGVYIMGNGGDRN